MHLAIIAEFMLALAIVLCIVMIIKSWRKSLSVNAAHIITVSISVCITFSMLYLTYSFLHSDFSLKIVYDNSHTSKPYLYKFTGVWANHEGSMLLFVWLLVLLSTWFSLSSNYEHKTSVLVIQSGITALLLLYVLFTSNPFITFAQAPANGKGLNPLLQDVGLALHPPLLYIGYVGFSLALSFAVIGLNYGVNRHWAQCLKPWVSFSLSFLTLGIGMGSWWAYRELGWGGYWFWDPVENSSLLPWLTGMALLHCLVVVIARDTIKKWTVFLSILTFSLSIAGFFLVRSGILSSVHSFASDPNRGLFMLALLFIVAGGSFWQFARRAHSLMPGNELTSLTSRETGLMFSALLFIVLTATILLGTLYPIFLEVLTEGSVSVGKPYFIAVFIPIALPALLLAGIAPLLNWKKTCFKQVIISSIYPIFTFLIIWLVLVFIIDEWFSLMSIGLSISGFLIVSMLRLYIERIRRTGHILQQPKTFIAMIISHIAVAIIAIGVIASSVWKQEFEDVIIPGVKTKFAGHMVTLTHAEMLQVDNYATLKAHFEVTPIGQKETYKLTPERRIYLASRMPTTESSVISTWKSDFYIVIGEGDNISGYAVRMYYKLGVNWIWLGCIMLGVGLIFSVYQRKKTVVDNKDIPQEERSL